MHKAHERDESLSISHRMRLEELESHATKMNKLVESISNSVGMLQDTLFSSLEDNI